MYEDIPYGGKEIIVDNNSKTLLLMFHGFTARPQVLLPIIEQLNDGSFDVYAPVVACHGSSIKEFCKSSLRRWLRSVDKAVESSLAKYEKVYVFGHSLGGLFAMHSALKYDTIKGVITLATPYMLTDKETKGRIMENIADMEGYTLGKRLSWGMITPRPEKKNMRVELKGINLFILRDRLKLRLKKIRQNVLNIHSKNDEVSSFDSQSVYCSLVVEGKCSILTLKKSMHTYFNTEEIPVICKAVKDFMQAN